MLRDVLKSDNAGQRVIFNGNEAIARGAIEAGIQVATAYPGTPSTEILESLLLVSSELGIYAEWSTNEKVAYEVAFGASICNLKSLVAMKHYGLNVALDALTRGAYTGVRGGLVLVVADDPSCHSSGTEQDSRVTAASVVEVPVFEPSDPQEAKDMLVCAVYASEKLGIPVVLRTTTRVSHSRGVVTLGEVSKERRNAVFEGTWMNLPGLAGVGRHAKLHELLKQAEDAFGKMPFNRIEGDGNSKMGIIASGAGYNYAKEAADQLSLDGRFVLLKLGTFPLPSSMLDDFLRRVERVLVVEEGEPVVETQVKLAAFRCGSRVDIRGKTTGDIPIAGELSSELVSRGLARVAGLEEPLQMPRERMEIVQSLVKRSNTFCSGCPHRATAWALKRAVKRVLYDKTVYNGDIGCYALAGLPPFEMRDTSAAMGSSIGFACGQAKAGIDRRPIALIGDSTFLHAGVPQLINAVFNDAKITVIIFDNETVAMTGFQPTPGAGVTGSGEETTKIVLEDVVKACGVRSVAVVDPYSPKDAAKAIEDALKHEGVSVVISRRLCSLEAVREASRIKQRIVPYRVDPEKCNGCRVCITMFGCPAIIWQEGKALIDPVMCVSGGGCGVCVQVCPLDAIEIGGLS